MINLFTKRPKRGEVRKKWGRLAQWTGEIWEPVEFDEAYSSSKYIPLRYRTKEYTTWRKFLALFGFIHFIGYILVGIYVVTKLF